MIKEVIEVLSSGVGIFSLAIILIGLFICKIIKDYKRARKGENEINFQKSDKYQKIYEEISKRELYKLRKKDVIIVAVFTTIITIATIAILIIELKKDSVTRADLCWAFAPLGVGVILMCFINKRGYNKKFVQEFIETTNGSMKVVNYIDCNDDYAKSQFLKIDGKEIRTPYVSHLSTDDYKIENEMYIEGNINMYSIKLFPCLELKERIGENFNYLNGSNEHWITFFEGIFVTIETDLKVPRIIMANSASPKNNLSDENIFMVAKLQIQNEFKIYTEDKEAAMEFLTPEILNVIAEFEEESKIKIDITFDKKIYIRFHTYPIFKVNLLNKNEDKISVHKYYIITKFIEELLENI